MNIDRCFWTFILWFVPAVTAGTRGATTPADLHGEIRQVYNFQPHTLDKAQIAQKSALLDQFWSKAKSQSEVYVRGCAQS